MSQFTDKFYNQFCDQSIFNISNVQIFYFKNFTGATKRMRTSNPTTLRLMYREMLAGPHTDNTIHRASGRFCHTLVYLMHKVLNYIQAQRLILSKRWVLLYTTSYHLLIIVAFNKRVLYILHQSNANNLINCQLYIFYWSPSSYSHSLGKFIGVHVAAG